MSMNTLETEIERTGKSVVEILKADFELVQNAEHWKGPIDAQIDEAMRDRVAEAIMFYTATEAKFTPGHKPGTLRVRSVGYWAGPAA